MATASKTGGSGVAAPRQADTAPAADAPDQTADGAADSAARGTGAATGSHPRAMGDQVARRHRTQVRLPLLGTVKLPAPDELAFLGGVGLLAVVGVIEWPLAVVLVAGHALASSHRNRVVREFGEALESA